MTNIKKTFLVGAALCSFGLATAAGGFALSYQNGKASRVVTRVVRYFLPEDPTKRGGNWALQSPVYGSAPVRAPVTMLGDSLTDYGDWLALLPGVRVQNHGIAGETTAGLLSRLRAGEQTATTVFLLIGVNDRLRGITIEDSKRNLASILQELQGKRVFLQSGVLTSEVGLNEHLAELNAFATDLCRRGQCTYVDLNRTLSLRGKIDPLATIDGIHLDWVGYTRWAGVIRPLILQVAQKPVAPVTHSRATDVTG